MPTTRPRHLITESDELADALDRAREHFPGQSRAELIRSLARLGAEALEARQQDRARKVHERAGRFPGVFPKGYLDDLRGDWPE